MLFPATLLLATLLCSLVAGFLFAFAVVVMPGIARLGDREYLRTFREMDGVIQRRHPVFGAVWLGSVLASLLLLALAGAGGPGAGLAAAAAGIYLLGVQLPTFVVNIPLNNELQAMDVAGASDEECRAARARFEPRWNGANRVRTFLAVASSVMLLAALSVG